MGEQMITYLNSKFKTPIFVAIAEFTGEKYEVEFITEKEAAEQKTASDKPSQDSAAVQSTPEFRSHRLRKIKYQSEVYL